MPTVSQSVALPSTKSSRSPLNEERRTSDLGFTGAVHLQAQSASEMWLSTVQSRPEPAGNLASHDRLVLPAPQQLPRGRSGRYQAAEALVD